MTICWNTLTVEMEDDYAAQYDEVAFAIQDLVAKGVSTTTARMIV